QFNSTVKSDLIGYMHRSSPCFPPSSRDVGRFASIVFYRVLMPATPLVRPSAPQTSAYLRLSLSLSPPPIAPLDNTLPPPHSLMTSPISQVYLCPVSEMESQKQVIERLRTAFRSGLTTPLRFRLTQLEALLTLLEDNETQILEAMHKDLAKPKFEAALSEIDMVVNDLCYTINNLHNWVQPSYVGKNLATKLDDCFVRREPLGLVLIIGAWNYPLQLIFSPLIGAIAAGNCAILKPSEISKATEKLISELIPKYLSQECYSVICGGADETKLLLENRFDHIFYTGKFTLFYLITSTESVVLFCSILGMNF
ncbi:hypothetical protein NFI96_031449, partial [Prochilodus magdalenae]